MNYDRAFILFFVWDQLLDSNFSFYLFFHVRSTNDKILGSYKVKNLVDSTYHKDYPEKHVEFDRGYLIEDLDPGAQIDQISPRRNAPGQFRGESSYAREFKPKHVESPSRTIKIPKKANKNKIGTSMYRKQFKEFGAEQLRNQSVDLYQGQNEPQGQRRVPKFKEKSSYAKDYPGWDPEAKGREEQAPARPKAGFAKETVYDHDFVGYEVQNNQNLRNSLEAQNQAAGEDVGNTVGLPRARMQGETTFKADYPGHQPEVTKVVRKERLGPIGKINKDTIYSKDYPAYDLEEDIGRGAGAGFNEKDLFVEDGGGLRAAGAKKRVKFDGVTNYKENYPGHQPKPGKPQPDAIKRQKGKMMTLTTYNNEFEEHPLKPGQGANQAKDYQFDNLEEFRGPKEKMQGKSTFMRDFPGHQPQPVSKRERRKVERVGKMQGKTMYGEDFVPHKIDPNTVTEVYDDLDYVKNSINAANKNKPKFDGETLYKKDYPGHQPEISPKRQQPRRRSPKKFNSKTTYNQNYLEHDIEAAQFAPHQDPRNLESEADRIKTRPERMQGKSKYQEDYPGHVPSPQKPVQRKRVKNHGKMATETMYGADYVGYDVNDAPNNNYQDNLGFEDPATQNGQNRERIKFKGDTRYKESYPGHQPVAQAKRTPKLKPNPGKFSGKTTYDKDYPKHEIQNLRQSGAEFNQLGDNALDYANRKRPKFRGSTTFKADYTEHNQPASKAIKPKLTRKNPHQMQNKTSYGLEFQEPEQDPYNFAAERPSGQDQTLETGEGRGQNNRNRPKFIGQTQYGEDYPGHVPEAREKEETMQRPKAPFKGSTVYNKDYYERQPELLQEGIGRDLDGNQGQLDGLEKPSAGRMQGETVFMRDYAGHVPQKKLDLKRREYKSPIGKIQGKSSYGAEFVQHPLDPQNRGLVGELDRLIENQLEKGGRNKKKPKFDGETQYKKTFVGHSVQREAKQAPIEKPKGRKMDLGTTYGVEFTGEQNRQENHPPAYKDQERELNEFRGPKEKMQGKSTFMRDFPGHQPQPVSKRERRKVERVGKMQGKTMYGEDFVPHKIDPSEATKQHEGIDEHLDRQFHERKLPKFADTTNYQKDYPGHIPEPKQQKKQKVRKPKGPFHKNTTYSKNYPKHEISNKEELARDLIEDSLGQQYQKPKDKMKGLTKYQEDFPGHMPAPVKQRKRPERKRHGKMATKTSYGADYEPHELRNEAGPDEGSIDLNEVDKNLRSFRRPKFKGETQYNEIYIAHHYQKRRKLDPIQKQKKGKFVGKTTYGGDYLKPEAELDGAGDQQNDFEEEIDTGFDNLNNRPKFRGETTFNADYVEHKPEGVRRNQSARFKPKNQAKMATKTSYNNDYLEYGPDPYEIVNDDNANPNTITDQHRSSSQRIRPKFSGKTNYQDDFIEQEQQAKQAEERAPERAKAPFTGKTVYNKDYAESPTRALKSKWASSAKQIGDGNDGALQDLYSSQRPRVRFRGETSYNQNYKGHSMEPRMNLKRRHYKSIGNFNGETTYGTNFVKPEGDLEINGARNRQSKKEEDLVYGEAQRKRVRPKFQSETNYRANFVERELPAKRREDDLKPRPKAKIRLTTTYNTEFDEKPVRKSLEQLPRDHYNTQNESQLPKRNIGATEKTIYQRTFKKPKTDRDANRRQKRQNRAKRIDGRWKNPAKMENLTMYRNDFKKDQKKAKDRPGDNNELEIMHKNIFEETYKTQNQHKPKFQGVTSYAENFKEKKGEKAPVHKARTKKSKKKFDGRTTYNTQFDRSNEIKRRKSGLDGSDGVKMRTKITSLKDVRFADGEAGDGVDIKNYRSQRAKFDGRTSYQAEFIGHELKKSKVAKRSFLSPRGRKFYGKTTYGSEYVSKKPEFNTEMEKPSVSQYKSVDRTRGVNRRFKPKFEGSTTYNREFNPSSNL